MKPFVAVLLTIGLVLPCIAGCSKLYRFAGIVVDGQGIGIVDADVLVYPHDDKQAARLSGKKTKQDGTFETGWVDGPGRKFFRMVVSKNGYELDKRIVLAEEENLRIVLSVASSKAE